MAISECVRLCSWVWAVGVLTYETCLSAVPDCSSTGLSMVGEAEKETITYKRLGLIVVIVPVVFMIGDFKIVIDSLLRAYHA